MRRATMGLMAATGALMLAASASAATVYSAGFDGASGTLNGANVVGVSGGTASLLLGGNQGQSRAWVETAAPGFGDGGFLRTTNLGGPNPYGIIVMPADAAHSLGAMSALVDGKWQINGGLDFFYRSDKAISDAAAALRLFGVSNATGLAIENFTSGDTVYMKAAGYNAGGNGESYTQNSNSTFTFAANTIYHMGLVFSTDAAGNSTNMKFMVQEGTGAIDTSATTLVNGFVSIAGFTLDPSRTGLSSGAWTFGNIETYGPNVGKNSPYVQDFDNLRLYDAVPSSFGAIAVPEPMSLGLLALSGLALLRRRK